MNLDVLAPCHVVRACIMHSRSWEQQILTHLAPPAETAENEVWTGAEFLVGVGC